jgi:DEAD/DEAH box helicase domain-containing protein
VTLKPPTAELHDLISRWKTDGRLGDLAVHATFPAQPEQTTPFPGFLHQQTLAALTAMGIPAPFAHQRTAWEHLREGHHLVIATPTASGKTLCYNIPVADTLCRDPAATALYLFPTKALARDQETAIRRLIALTGIDAKAVVYDGDTPGTIRKTARREASIIITNPDMLHQGILPHHPDWARFLSQLRFVVIDELHQYRGIFGSHVANVIRRLRRLTAFHGATPIFAACSATVRNPRELGKAVLGVSVDVIDHSGAPRGRRDFLVVNPPLVDAVMGVRASAMKTAARLSARLVNAGFTTLCFCQTRRGVEIVLHYLKDRITRAGKDPDRIRGYRGGYLPNLRREIEKRLQEGHLDAVVATSALELGIDVGGLDAVVLAGYPGTIAATHQRGGRAGRRENRR